MTAVYTDAAELAQHHPDIILDFAGFGTTTTAAIAAVKEGGRVVVVGLGKIGATISTNLLVTKNVQLFGSLGGSKDDLVEVYQLITSGQLQPVVTEIGFDEIPDGLTRLSKGGIVGRLVAHITD